MESSIGSPDVLADEERDALRAEVSDLAQANAELRRTKEALQESKRFLQSVIDGIPESLMVIDRNRRVVLANRTVRELAGGKDPDTHCLLCYQVSHHCDGPCGVDDHPCPWEQVVATKAPVVVLHTHLDAKGNEIPVEVVAAPIFDAHGDVVQIIETCRDISERRRAEEERRRLETQLLQAQKLESLGVLAGGVAHDFNNLLVGVLGHASLALALLPPGSAACESVRQIETAAQRAADLTRQMLAYSGKGKFIVEPIDLCTLVEEMAHLLEASASRKAVLRYDFPADLPPIEADATQIRQVVMNLITNASEAIGDRGGGIAVRTRVVETDRPVGAGRHCDEELPPGRYVVMEVTDNGCGMNEDTQAKIFDPFFTTKFAGRGLGLAAVLGIVRGHHGTIQVDSRPGQGSTFRVWFPAADGSSQSAPMAPPMPKSLRDRGTVLVVDDEEMVRSVAKAILEQAGFEVLTAANGIEALNVFGRQPDGVDAVLLDLTMPELSGEQVLRELRGIRADVPVILSSGYHDPEAVHRLTGSGHTGFVHKPYRPTVLVDKLREVCGRVSPANM
jgi:two-component system cell cycle sensor histidine kinase/response regulator CckA